MKAKLFSGKDILKDIPNKLEAKTRSRVTYPITFDVEVQANIDLTRRLQEAVSTASAVVARLLKEALDDAIRSQGWGGDDGDIYDSGELMNSGVVIADSTGVRVKYDADYAALIHYGGYITPYGNVNARVYLPPKPWLEAVMFGGGPVDRFDLMGIYEREIIKALQ